MVAAGHRSWLIRGWYFLRGICTRFYVHPGSSKVDVRVVATSPAAKTFFGHPSLLVAFAFCLLNPFFEELIVRAYLMTEIIELTGSSALAVVLSVVVQFSYHLYYGWTGAASLCFQFLTFALYYARSRRALPIIMAHGFFDVFGMLRLLSK